MRRLERLAKSQLPLPETHRTCVSMQPLQADNKIVAVGYSGEDMALVRYLGEVQAQLDNIVLIAPANDAMNVNYAGVSMSWNEPLGAVSYELQIAVDDQFLDLALEQSTGSNNFLVADLQPGTVYYWRVRASDGTLFGEYSATRLFTTNTLENFSLQTPANLAVDVDFNTVSFNWTYRCTGAAGYQLSYATDMALRAKNCSP